MRGVIHDTEVGRWVASGRLDLDAVVESNYLALDFMSLDRGAHAGQVVQPGSTDTSTGSGKTNANGTGDTSSGANGSAGEMRTAGRYRGADIPALPTRQRTYMDSARQTATEQQPGTTAHEPMPPPSSSRSASGRSDGTSWLAAMGVTAITGAAN